VARRTARNAHGADAARLLNTAAAGIERVVSVVRRERTIKLEDRLMSRILLSALALTFGLAGCGKEAKQEGPSQGNPPASALHASSTVVPGSYEDWCTEHQVPETSCTRCDPSLVPAFKATNDWCAEHGLPESQCLACNPDLKIVRPPQPEGR
jgi:hypothetical protein